MRFLFCVSIVLLCALSMSACTSEEDKREARALKDRQDTFYAGLAEERIKQEVIHITGEISTMVECPDALDEFVRLGCTATTSGDPGERLKIAVRRDAKGNPRVKTKLLDTAHFERRLLEGLETTAPDRTMWEMDCPKLVQRRKGARFVCRGKGILQNRQGATRCIVRGRFSNAAGDISYRVQHSPAVSR